MTDIRDPRLLWIKAGLFLLLGGMASAILLMESGSVRIVLMLAIAIWAFCRAYYFAFYGIEKYVDPNFQYAGLLALSRSAFKKLLGRTTDEQSILTATAPQSGKKTWSDVYIEITKWFLIAAIGNFLVPILFSLRSSEQLSFLRFSEPFDNVIVEYIVTGLIGFLYVEIALAAVLGAMLDVPIKFRLPLSFLATFFLSVAFIFGHLIAEYFYERHISGDESTILLFFQLFAQGLAVGIVLTYRKLSRSCLTTAGFDHSNAGNDGRNTGQQFSIRYLLIGMTIIALCLAVSKAIGLKRVDLLDTVLFLMILSGIITLAFIAFITMLCFEIALRSPQRNAHFKAIALLVSYLCFPSVIIVIVRSLRGPMLSITIESGIHFYVFFACYIGLLLWVCTRFRKSGLRLVQRET